MGAAPTLAAVAQTMLEALLTSSCVLGGCLRRGSARPLPLPAGASPAEIFPLPLLTAKAAGRLAVSFGEGGDYRVPHL